jgi:hypothetical protein
MVLMLAAISIYVISDDLALLPLSRPTPPPQSGSVGK